MNLKIFLSIVLVMSFILFGLIYISDQNVYAFNNYNGINFVAPLDPYQIVYQDEPGFEHIRMIHQIQLI